MTRARFLAVSGLAAAAVAGVVWWLIATSPEPIVVRRFLVIPGGWIRFLAGFLAVVAGTTLVTWSYGRMVRPMKAGQYALAAGTHLFLWLVIVLIFYPVVYLVAVSLNTANSLTAALPPFGNIFVRAGILPDPARFGFVQYQKLLAETHILWYQWIFIGIAALAIVVLVGALLRSRTATNPHRMERWSTRSGWTLFLALAVLVVSVNPSQFYTVNEAGERVGATSIGMVVLFIRNTLLVSGTTGLFAVAIATTAGYAFARMRFEGRYQTLLTFVFVQMFPGFMALVAIFFLMSYLGLLNTFTGLILAYSGGAIAFSAWIFKGYLESISPSLEEAAMVDGATRWGAFWRIILPISVPMLLFIFLLQFIGTYSEFILASTLLRGVETWTVGIGLRAFTTGSFDTRWGELAATAVLGSLPILVIFYSFQQALTGQYQAGGVKG